MTRHSAVRRPNTQAFLGAALRPNASEGPCLTWYGEQYVAHCGASSGHGDVCARVQADGGRRLGRLVPGRQSCVLCTDRSHVGVDHWEWQGLAPIRAKV